MTRTFFRLLVGAIVLLAVPAAVPAPARAESYPSLCPAMTDSITRLYLGYFGRDPDPAGFNHWVGVYRSGSKSLENISQNFSLSPEFETRNLLGNTAFVTWMYNSLLDREATPAELDHWVRALDGGYPRGSVMLTVTESYDFVMSTQTAPPLAGYLRWYPDGTHWYCDIGSVTVGVNPLVDSVWADYYFHNRSEGADDIVLWTLDGNRNREVRMNAATLQSGFTDYNWDGVFRGDGDYGRYIEVQAGDTTDWIVVFYPRSIGEDRLGWQLAS